jgi:hypothetical protein
MGYYIFSYGIDAQKIKASFNSNDEKLLQKIKATETFENYKDFLPDGFKTTPDKALEDIIKNNPYDTKSNFAYGYALICICDALGSKLPYRQEIKLGYETDLIDKYLADDFGIKDLKVDTSLLFTDDEIPFDIPPRDDFPVISFLPTKKLHEIHEKMEHIKIDAQEAEALIDDGENEEDEDKGCAYLHINGIIENIRYCINNNLEMINFCH